MAVTSIQTMRDDLPSTEDSLSYRQDNIEPMDASPDRVARIQAEWRRERPEIDTSPQGVIGRLHRVAALLTEELVAVSARATSTCSRRSDGPALPTPGQRASSPTTP
jgi:hypothetical protein